MNIGWFYLHYKLDIAWRLDYDNKRVNKIELVLVNSATIKKPTALSKFKSVVKAQVNTIDLLSLNSYTVIPLQHC